jgi:hypothetical protein
MMVSLNPDASSFDQKQLRLKERASGSASAAAIRQEFLGYPVPRERRAVPVPAIAAASDP